MHKIIYNLYFFNKCHTLWQIKNIYLAFFLYLLWSEIPCIDIYPCIQHIIQGEQKSHSNTKGS